MIKQIVTITLLISMVIFSGCADKNPEMMNDNQSMDQKEAMEKEAMEKVEEYEAKANDSMNNSLSPNDYDYYNTQVTLADGTKGTIKQIFFAYDKYNLSTEMLNRVKENANVFSKLSDSDKIKLEGYCDEWGSDEYNYALGLKRAKTVKDALVRENINKNKISLVSYGESHPVCTSKRQSCWKLNRRVENKILP